MDQWKYKFKYYGWFGYHSLKTSINHKYDNKKYNCNEKSDEERRHGICEIKYGFSDNMPQNENWDGQNMRTSEVYKNKPSS